VNNVPRITTSAGYDSEDDVFDEDDMYNELVEEDKIYSTDELSKILKEGKTNAHSEKVYESIQNIKSRSLNRRGSARPPPRPSVRVRESLCRKTA